MLYLQKRKTFFYGLPFLLVIFAGNHWLDASRQQARNQAKAQQPQVVVRAEYGTLGHNSIGIDEKTTVWSNGATLLHFSTLADWEYDPKQAAPCPASIRQLNGREVHCVGFMYPLTAGKQVKVFCLLRSTQTCCYGPRPQYNQYLLVECKEPVDFERLAPVMVRGKFWADPQPDQGFIYRMEAVSVQRIGEEAPEVNAAVEARKARLPLFLFSILAQGKPVASAVLPKELLVLDHKQVVVEGYCVGRLKGDLPGVMVSQDWWDGVSKGKRPNLFNTVLVFPQDASQDPPLWQTHGVFTGTLKVTRDPHLWPKDGIVSLHSAKTGIAGRGPQLMLDAGAMLPIKDEALILCLFLLYTIRWKRKAQEQRDERLEGEKR